MGEQQEQEDHPNETEEISILFRCSREVAAFCKGFFSSMNLDFAAWAQQELAASLAALLDQIKDLAIEGLPTTIQELRDKL